jgi:hypothetical protein
MDRDQEAAYHRYIERLLTIRGNDPLDLQHPTGVLSLASAR